MEPLHVFLRPTPDQGPEHPARERVAAQRRAARAALDEAARRIGLAVAAWPQEQEGGRPLPVGGLHWSISHDADYVAAVLAPVAVGIDLERIAQRRAALTERVADEQERALFPTFDAQAFTRLWTAKEARLKVAGVGLGELSRCRLEAVLGDELRLRHRGALHRVIETRFGDHILALAAALPEGSAPEVVWHLPEP